MFYPLLLKVGVESSLSFSYAPELAAVFFEDLSWLRALTDRLAEERGDGVYRALFEYRAACNLATVVVQDYDEPPSDAS